MPAWRDRRHPISVRRLSRPAAPTFTARSWVEADLLFHSDPRWRGSDNAYSIELSPGRTLWLFDDSWITDGGPRDGAIMINNSLGIQVGADPSTASMTFHWDDSGEGPGSFFLGDGEERLWQRDPVWVDGTLLLFFATILFTHTSGPWGFEHVGWKARLVENPHDDVADWRVREVATAAVTPWGFNAAASTIVHGDHLYGFSLLDDRTVGLFRWGRDRAAQGDLSAPETWAGDGPGWVPGDGTQRPATVMDRGHTEFTVRWVESLQRFVQVQGIGIECSLLGARVSERLEGPWSPLEAVFTPDEAARPGTFIYAFKAHPEQDAGGDMVVTYATNAEQVLNDESIYWPRFVRVSLEA